jgi:shikimate kinase
MSNIYTKKNIVFIGYMASGKSTISQKIAQSLKFEWFDTDKIIENKFNDSIENIFNSHGELFFRKNEHLIFKELLQANEYSVISTGGGLPCYYNNHEWFKNENVLSIYLQYHSKTLAERLKNEKSKRPLVKNLKNVELEEYIAKHLFERSFYYLQAKHIITCDEKSVDEIVEECLSLVLSP